MGLLPVLAEGVGYSGVHGQMSGKNFVNLKTSFSGSVVCVVGFLFVLGRVILITLPFCKVCWPRQAQTNIDLRFARPQILRFLPCLLHQFCSLKFPKLSSVLPDSNYVAGLCKKKLRVSAYLA